MPTYLKNLITNTQNLLAAAVLVVGVRVVVIIVKEHAVRTGSAVL